MYHKIDNIESSKKIILDSDVLIHFHKADKLASLVYSFSNSFCILQQVWKELSNNRELTKHLRSLVKLKKIEELDLGNDYELALEYANMIMGGKIGKGEAACMVYCKYNKDIVGSSNLSDVHCYCEKNNITYLTTMDFLYKLYKDASLTRKECNDFVTTVISKNSNLPYKNFDIFLSTLN